MLTGRFNTPLPTNEPIYGYAPGSAERAELEAELVKRNSAVVEIPCVVGGERIFTGRTIEVTMPCDHGHVLAIAHLASPEVVEKAISKATDIPIELSNLFDKKEKMTILPNNAQEVKNYLLQNI